MYAEALKRAWTERRSLIEEVRALNESTEGREPTAEERATAERLEAAIASLDAKIGTGLEAVETEQRMAAALADLDLRAKPGAPSGLAAHVAAEEKAALEFARGERRAVDFAPLTGEEAAEVRALNKGTGSAGGNTVPTTMFDQIVVSLRDLSTVMAAGARVVRTAAGENITVPVSGNWSAASIIDEGTTVSTSEPSFGTNVTVGAYKYAFLAQASPELVNDSAFDVIGYLAEQGGDALAHGTGAHFIAGNGSGQPDGIINVSNGKTLASASAVTADEMIDLYHSVLRPYRRNAVWVLNDSTVVLLRKLKDTTNQYLWQPGLTLGQPDTFLGRPVLTDPSMPAMGAANRPIVFGDLGRAYLVRVAGAIRVERSDDFAFSSDLITWKWVMRADGRIVDTAAAKRATCP